MVIVAIGLIGCNKNEVLNNNTSPSVNRSPIIEKNDSIFCEPENELVLGEKIDNPYSVANMQSVYDSLVNVGVIKNFDIFQNGKIVPTHYYVHIITKDTAQYFSLINDENLTLFSFPLNYKIEKAGSYYNNPDNHDDIVNFYTVLNTSDFNYYNSLFNIEILDDCFIPDYEQLEKNGVSQEHINILKRIELESLNQKLLLQEGEYKEIFTDIYYVAKSDNYSNNTSGYVKVQNTLPTGLPKPFVKYDGVKRVKVRFWKFLRFYDAWTDDNGYYTKSTSFILKNINYAVEFTNQTGFKIYDNIAFFYPAIHKLNDTYTRKGVDIYISTNPDAWYWGVINNAMLDYRVSMCPHFGVTPPPSNFTLWRMGINSNQWAGSTPMAHHVSLNATMLNNFAGIYIPAYILTGGLIAVLDWIAPDMLYLDKTKKTEIVYSIIFHELSHASHYMKAGNIYWQNYITGIIYNMGYGNSVNDYNAGYIGLGEMWGNFFGYKCEEYYNNYIYSNLWVYSLGDVGEWYHPELLRDLNTNALLQFTPAQIYSCLTSDVTNFKKFKEKLISNYGTTTAKVNAINQIFTYYGF